MPEYLQTFFSRFWADEVPVDNTLVNVFPMKDKIYATSETNFIFEINPATLDSLKRVNFTDEFPGKEDIGISKCFKVI